MILRKIVARNRWETAWVHEGVCVTSAVVDLEHGEVSVDQRVGNTEEDLRKGGFRDESILTLLQEIEEKITGGNW